ncbi:hypothetical protein [Breoghania sp.]|uniref:hypothetical protein n=1 Tax=Breoghania sp. TaxID=2065378 RepID=UPI002634A2AD|nr:hypothetical protein [Breoghania sp.]MDJ0932624.1 hypothetical protein [Breoghania sp.]
MKRTLLGAASFVVLLVVAALVIPFFLPKDAIKHQIVSQVESATGWRLRLDGAVGVEFVKAAEIDFGLSLSALMGGKARVTGTPCANPKSCLRSTNSAARAGRRAVR